MRCTRIKICGLTRQEDVISAVAAGADAIGFVFYPHSPRYITPAVAGRLLQCLPPYVSAVGLFVNADVRQVRAVLELAPVSLLQFHGDETVEDCVSMAEVVNRPFTRALRIKAETTTADLLEYESQYRAASPLFSGLLLDNFVEGYGGGGKVFDWSLIPKKIAPQIVLSGGLHAHNVADAVHCVRPGAVDVSSGVEVAKGIKDAEKIRVFIDAVQAADASLADQNQT